MDEFDLEIKKEFLNEALMNLEEAEGSFMELESASDTKPLLDKIFRLAHNLKGGSRAVGFGDVAEFTHELENLVLKIQKGEVGLSSDVVTTLLRSNDRLVEMLTKLKEDLNAHFDNADIIADIKSWLQGRAPTVEAKTLPPQVQPQEALTVQVAAVEVAPVIETKAEVQIEVEAEIEPEVVAPPVVPSADAFFAQENVVEIKPNPVETKPAVEAKAPSKSEAPSANQGGDKGKEDEVIRVNLSRIDLLNDYVGELIVLQSVIQQQASFEASNQLQAAVRMMTKLSKDIQSLSMSLRMLPVKPLIQKLQRAVRDTAKVLNKEVDFEVVGDQIDIDKSVLDRLADPLIHILRNAVDHGLETTEGRIKSGKNPQGLVKLTFSTEGNHLVVEVSDDGKGIDAQIIRKKALEKKVISDKATLSEKQLINLVFHAGFSTKTETSEISGRGVGMDVVKTNVERIGGQVDINTQVGKGSVFRIQIPLSLAVIDGLVVTSESNRYVVPLSQVQETINLGSQKIYESKLGIGPCFELRGTVVPVFEIEEVLSNKKLGRKIEGTGLIVNIKDQIIALAVRDIVRAQQIVIKPLGNGIRAQRGWVGSCVLGDGLPTLILSPVDLLEGKVVQSFSVQPNTGVA